MGFKEIKNKTDKNILVGKVSCPACGSTDTIASNAAAGLWGTITIICFLGFCFSIWIPIIGWITTPFFAIGFIISLIVWIVTAVALKYTFYCKDCNKKYKISKKEYFKLAK